jgi:glutaredoxin
MMKEKHAEKKSAVGTFLKDPWRVGLSLVVILLLVYIALEPKAPKPPSGGEQPGGEQTKKANVTIELFVMSQCPYGVQAEEVVKKVIDGFGGEVNLSLHFIADANSNGSFSSLHGQPEVEEDLRQVCIMKYYPNSLLEYLSCVATGYTNVGSIWESCASQNKIDVNIIEGCSTGSEGKALLSENIKRSDEAGVSLSPTIYLNGQAYSGGRDESSLTRGVCTLIPGSSTCKNLPPEVSVELTIINDEDCLLCDTSGIENSLRSMISNMSIRRVSYASVEGGALLQRFNITGVPVYIFNSSVAQHSGYATLSRYLQKVDSSYILAVQPVKLLGRVAENNTLQLFVMSQCPYGTMAEKAMKELLDALPGVKFSGLHFIANENTDGSFSSLHGQPEVEEDLRQVCIIKYYPGKLFNYLMCVAADYTNVGGIWERCANESSIDAGKIRSCASGDEGKALLREDIAATNSISIYSSPTILLNNNTIFSTIYAEEIKQVVCAHNPDLNGCNKTLSGAGETAPSGGCG